MRTMKTVAASVTALLTATTTFAQLKQSDMEKLNEAATVLSEIRNAPDNGIPDSIWNKAECVVVIPDLKKAGFIQARTGKGSHPLFVHPITKKEVWIALHTKKDAGRLGYRILRDAGLED